MIVGGIVLNRGWWSVILTPEVVAVQVQLSSAADSVPTQPSGTTTLTPEVIDEVTARDDPQPFIQVGGLPVIFGTAIISHFLASDLGQRLLYGSDEDQLTYEMEHTR